MYHNPDPLYRLIGEPNEASVIVENQKVKGLIYSRAQVSSVSDKFAKELNLEVKKLETLLDLEPTGGGQVPYNGYMEVRLQIPNVRAFDLDVLMLVIPESAYVSLRLCVQNAVPAQPCVGKLGISLVLLNFLHCNFRLWFKTP